MKEFLAGQSPAELRAWAENHGFPAWRGTQIAEWLYRHHTPVPAEMKNLPAELRKLLAESFYAPGTTILETVPAPDGVRKLKLGLFDGEVIEMALIPARERLTFCLSTQVGCPVGCRFCASGACGFRRNLAAGEMIEELLLGIATAGRRCDNIVFMGIGEGLLNFHELATALNLLTSENGFNFSPRRITVSTSGYLPGMEEFARLGREYTLAISLHAPDDATRARLIPDKLRYPVADILTAADRCREATGRQYTLEYTLVAGINDSPETARRLGELARTHHAKVNLIPLNAAAGNFRRPSPETIRDFEAAVAAAGARVTRRVERGGTRGAACGQLRAESLRQSGSGAPADPCRGGRNKR